MRHAGNGVLWYAMRTPGVRHQQGSVYIVALLTLTVLGILATAIGWSALVQAQQAQRREVRWRLESLAQSGVTYATWERRYNGRRLPFTHTLSLSEGTVQIRAEKDPAYGDNAMKVTTTATSRGESITRTRIVDGTPQRRAPFEFALYVGRALVVPPGSQITVKGDVHTAGLLSVLTGGNLQVEGAVISLGRISGSVAQTLYREPFSSIGTHSIVTLPELRMKATQLRVGATHLPFGLSLSDGSIYYVQGDLRIGGTLQGRAIVVVEGNLYILSNLDYRDEDTLFVFVVGGNIQVPSGRRVRSILVDQGGTVQLGDNTHIVGGVIAMGSASFGTNVVIEHDPRVNANLFQQEARAEEIDDDGVRPVEIDDDDETISPFWGP